MRPPSWAAVPRKGVRGHHRCRRVAGAPSCRRCEIRGFSTLGSLILFRMPPIVSEGEEGGRVCLQSFPRGWPRFPQRGERRIRFGQQTFKGDSGSKRNWSLLQSDLPGEQAVGRRAARPDPSG